MFHRYHVFLHLSVCINLLALLTSAAPTRPSLPAEDAPFTEDVGEMNAAITCPKGLNNAPNGIVLLVPGTALNGRDSYEEGPYVSLLPREGFDVCWVDTPKRGMADAQVAGEYVANAIMHLAPQSSTKKIKVMGHSQGGGLNIPWATIFYPSARNLVEAFVGQAPDFHGTTILPYPACAVEKLASLGVGCSPAILQQEYGSMYLKAQQTFLTEEIVPTTSIFTRTDEIVIPEFGPKPSSRLPGSVQFPLQDHCSVLELSDHLSIIANPAAYAVTLNAFKSPTGKADLSKFNPSTDCFNITESDLNLNDIGASIRYLAGVGTTIVDSGGAFTMGEPALKQCECIMNDIWSNAEFFNRCM